MSDNRISRQDTHWANIRQNRELKKVNSIVTQTIMGML